MVDRRRQRQRLRSDCRGVGRHGVLKSLHDVVVVLLQVLELLRRQPLNHGLCRDVWLRVRDVLGLGRPADLRLIIACLLVELLLFLGQCHRKMLLLENVLIWLLMLLLLMLLLLLLLLLMLLILIMLLLLLLLLILLLLLLQFHVLSVAAV